MDVNWKLLALLVAVVGGMAVGTQALLNGSVGRSRGVLEAIFVSVSVSYLGTVAAMGLKATATRHFGLPMRPVVLGVVAAAAVLTLIVLIAVARDFPLPLLSPGLLGLVVLFAGTFAAPVLGVGLTAAALTAGQIGIGLVWDQLGVLGLPEIPLSPLRVVGMALIIVGVVLVRGLP